MGRQVDYPRPACPGPHHPLAGLRAQQGFSAKEICHQRRLLRGVRQPGQIGIVGLGVTQDQRGGFFAACLGLNKRQRAGGRQVEQGEPLAKGLFPVTQRGKGHIVQCLVGDDTHLGRGQIGLQRRDQPLVQVAQAAGQGVAQVGQAQAAKALYRPADLLRAGGEFDHLVVVPGEHESQGIPVGQIVGHQCRLLVEERLAIGDSRGRDRDQAGQLGVGQLDPGQEVLVRQLFDRQLLLDGTQDLLVLQVGRFCLLGQQVALQRGQLAAQHLLLVQELRVRPSAKVRPAVAHGIEKDAGPVALRERKRLLRALQLDHQAHRAPVHVHILGSQGHLKCLHLHARADLLPDRNRLEIELERFRLVLQTLVDLADISERDGRADPIADL